MAPITEGEPWGEAAQRPYVGRNWAAFIMGLYITSHPDIATQRLLRTLRGRHGRAMPVGKGRSSPERGQQAGSDREGLPGGTLTPKILLTTWNEAICDPPLPRRELMKTLKSAQRYTDGRKR